MQFFVGKKLDSDSGCLFCLRDWAVPMWQGFNRIMKTVDDFSRIDYVDVDSCILRKFCGTRYAASWGFFSLSIRIQKKVAFLRSAGKKISEIAVESRWLTVGRPIQVHMRLVDEVDFPLNFARLSFIGWWDENTDSCGC